MRLDRANFAPLTARQTYLPHLLLTATRMVVASLASVLLCGISQAATSANAQSPLAMNLNNVNYYDPEQPFLNIFKTSGITHATPNGWSTRSAAMNETNEESLLQLDANGYPTTLKGGQFTQVCLLLMNQLPPSNAGTGPRYRSGQYVVLYDGQGSLSYSSDAQPVSTSAGRDIFNVANPSANGVWMCVTSTDPNGTGNYLHNIRVVKAEEESLLTAGQVFEPSFLSLLSPFRLLRAMQWLNIDNTPTPPGNWANRALPTDAGWGSQNGVPYEVIIQLCNAISADCWLNVPHTADNNFITQLATLAHGSLGSSQKVYIEFSNEVWNGGYPQYQYAVNQGKATWPSANAPDYQYNRDWYGMRVAQTCDIWKAAWGADASRVVCVLGAQGANTTSATESLNCPLWTGTGNTPCSAHGIGAVAISPYFGFITVQSSWLSAADGGLSQLFTALNADVANVSGQETSYKSALAPYNLPLVAYEGGQTLVGFPQYQNGSAVVNLFIKANRDPRMGAAYTTALNNWKANGGTVYTLFLDIYPPSQYGEWGALESFLDTVTPLTSAPPKWQAIRNFISGNSCWWAGCTGTTGGGPPPAAVPMPPTNLSVH